MRFSETNGKRNDLRCGGRILYKYREEEKKQEVIDGVDTRTLEQWRIEASKLHIIPPIDQQPSA
jgi:hypothetical protein